jgi:indolepyruvate ferredoxin oxidoreductase
VERGLNVAIVMDRLAPLLEMKMAGPAAPRTGAVARARQTADYKISIPIRTPTFCPGCPHRDSSTVTKALKADFQDAAFMKQNHKRDPVEA